MATIGVTLFAPVSSDLDDIEKNHEAYAASRTIAASNAVKKLARAAPGEVVPLAS